jgi:hypothetical protein
MRIQSCHHAVDILVDGRVISKNNQCQCMELIDFAEVQ